MNKSELENLLNEAKTKLESFSAQYNDIATEIARLQGDIRTYTDLIEKWVDKPEEPNA